MLWKYKKVYQIEAETPPVETCINLLNIAHTYTHDAALSRELTIEYIMCGDPTNTVITEIVIGTPDVLQFFTVNKCIKSDSLFLNGVNINDETTTFIPDYTVKVDFEQCGDTCEGVTETISSIVDVTYQIAPEGYLVNCNLASYCYLQYSLDGTSWITLPTLYPPSSALYLVPMPEGVVKVRFSSRCQQILSLVAVPS